MQSIPFPILEAVSSEKGWTTDPYDLYEDTEGTYKITKLAPGFDPKHAHKRPVAISDNKEFYLPSFVNEYNPADLNRIHKAMQKLIKLHGHMTVLARKGLKAGNEIVPLGTASKEQIRKYGSSSERLGVMIIATINGRPLSEIAELIEVEELLGPKRQDNDIRRRSEEEDEEGEEYESEPTYITTLRRSLQRLESEKLIEVMQPKVAMFPGYAAIYVKHKPNTVMLFHRKVGRGFYIIPQNIQMWSGRQSEFVHWKKALSAFKDNPLLYMKSIISPGGPLYQARDSHPRLYSRINDIVDAMESESVEHYAENKPRLLFRRYLVGTGQLVGETVGGAERAFSRKDREQLVDDILAWASPDTTGAISGENPAVAEAVSRMEYVIIEDYEIPMVVSEDVRIVLDGQEFLLQKGDEIRIL